MMDVTQEPKAGRIPAPTELPEDLSVWIDRRTLMGLVLECVGEVGEGSLRRVAPPDAGPAFQPPLLLALLTYCYLIGIAASQDIERFLCEDRMFRARCGNEFPDWHLLRLFRRANHGCICRCLESTMIAALGLHLAERSRARNGSFRTPSLPAFGLREAASGLIPDAAAGRLERALMLDSLALED